MNFEEKNGIVRNKVFGIMKIIFNMWAWVYDFDGMDLISNMNIGIYMFLIKIW